MTDTTYNGWKNWATWNVALWMQNHEGLYRVARQGKTYAEFVQNLEGLGVPLESETPDGARWNDPTLDTAALDEMLADDF